MYDALKTSICEVVFLKANGDERTMFCTLSPDILGEFEGSSSVPVEDQITVWDIEVDAWRSFKPSKVLSFESLEE